jgi:hypothetical protein
MVNLVLNLILIVTEYQNSWSGVRVSVVRYADVTQEVRSGCHVALTERRQDYGLRIYYALFSFIYSCKY